jgi:hypothetical protein
VLFKNPKKMFTSSKNKKLVIFYDLSHEKQQTSKLQKTSKDFSKKQFNFLERLQ